MLALDANAPLFYPVRRILRCHRCARYLLSAHLVVLTTSQADGIAAILPP